MKRPIPQLEDYGISPHYGFLPSELPLEVLPDPYYADWEIVVADLPNLLESKRLRHAINGLPVLSISRLYSEPEWRRAYSLLGFMAHAYIWGGNKPCGRLPPPISIPFLAVAEHLEIPPVATYASVCLWNFKPNYVHANLNCIDGLSTFATFTGTLDESWFYLVSITIEAHAAPTIQMLLDAVTAARTQDVLTVTLCLQAFAETLEDLGELLERMHEKCDPHVFYNKIRPYLAGSKNMAEAGLPRGVVYDDGTGSEEYRQYSGGSNAQSSLIQFFDIMLGVVHRPTGHGVREISAVSAISATARSLDHNARLDFLKEMRSYMPGPHRRFLEDVSKIANIRQFVEGRSSDIYLRAAFNDCLAMLRSLRDKHMRIVSRYIVKKSRDTRPHVQGNGAINLASPASAKRGKKPNTVDLKGTGGTGLIPFLLQVRNETGGDSMVLAG